MFKRNRDFILATATILIQQLLLAGSTWSIAAAGAAVSLDDYASAKEYVIGFFALALAAYITSSFSEIFANNAANSIWRNYSNQIVLKVSADGELSSANNRKLVSQWISTEAGTTISSASGYYLGSVSVIANILLTSVVFFATLGPVISGSVIVSLVISLAFVLLAKSRIRQLSTKIQVLRMNAIGHIENWLVNGFFGTKPMSDNAHDKFNHDTERYFESTRSYVATEQIVACVPITISVFIISITLFYMSPASAIQVGVLVAVLPRSLQLLGNVHSFSIYLSQFVMIGQKIKNLESFAESLERQVFTDQIHPKDIVTTNTANGLAVEQAELLALIKNNGSTGRYLISGPNGSGKSTLLQLIKSKTESCILVTPGAYFSQQADSHSTGQLMLAELSVLLHEPSAVLLLDEWDANLDAANIQIINDKVQKISEKKLIIEVRHRNFQRAITPQSLGSV